MSQIDFGCIFDGFTMNLRFGIGEKSRGRVEPFFSPVGDRDYGIIIQLLGRLPQDCVVIHVGCFIYPRVTERTLSSPCNLFVVDYFVE